MGLRGSLAACERPMFARMDSCLRTLGEGVAELLWPTRCVICDVPGALLCDKCRLEIPYIDPLRACPYCGQAYGKLACVDCNSFIVEHRGLFAGERISARGDATGLSGECPIDRHVAPRERLLDQVVSVFTFVDPYRKIVTAYKDRKEIRLANVLAEMLNAYIDPRWVMPGNTAIVVIPARDQAIRERGFDHMKEVGRHLSRASGLPLLDLLALADRSDQRGLSASSRRRNMRGTFVPKWPPGGGGEAGDARWLTERLPARVILVDDVLTTGATLLAAAHTLKEMGVHQVIGLTLGRVP